MDDIQNPRRSGMCGCGRFLFHRSVFTIVLSSPAVSSASGCSLVTTSVTLSNWQGDISMLIISFILLFRLFCLLFEQSSIFEILD